MSLVVLGLSHRSAPLSVLEATALDRDGAATLARRLRAGECVTEAVVLATCNRVEMYADAVTFHGAVSEMGEALAATVGLSLGTLRQYLYVHYEDRAIAHCFSVACGLDSMAVGEGQILGQLRDALRLSHDAGQSGGVLSALFQQALRVGKRAHAETGLDQVSASIVTAGLDRAADVVGPLDQARVLIVGAGSMSSLAANTVARAGAAALVILNRTPERARRLAAATGGTARPFEDLPAALVDADVVISCTGAVGELVRAADAAAAADQRRTVMGPASFPRPAQVYLDLALPRDVDPEVARVDGVVLLGLGDIGRLLSLDRPGEGGQQLQQVHDLVTSEVATYLTERRAQAVAPTVAALRSRAAEVVAAELGRLDQRLPALGDVERAEVQLAVHRVVEKLLHTPTVRVKELAGDGSGDYALALRELFDLDPHDVATVSVPPEGGAVP